MFKFLTVAFLYLIPLTFAKDVNFCDNKYECPPNEHGRRIHTFCILEHNCQVAPNCTEYEKALLTEEDKKALLDVHNEYRNKHALGDSPNSKGGEPFPTAANMRELVWDKELELSAQCWANQCPNYHDACRKLSDGSTIVGQNLAWSTEVDLSHMIDRFYNECRIMPVDRIDKFDDEGMMIGHFTQVVWATTTRIGCGRTKYYYENGKISTYFLTCNYAEAGNWATLPVYQKGKPCSKCPKGSKCHPTYKGLCTTKPSKSVMPNICKFSADPSKCVLPFEDSLNTKVDEKKQDKTQKKDKHKNKGNKGDKGNKGNKGNKGTKGTKGPIEKGTNKPDTSAERTTSLVQITHENSIGGAPNEEEEDSNKQCIIERKVIIIRSGSGYGKAIQNNLIFLLYFVSKSVNYKF